MYKLQHRNSNVWNIKYCHIPLMTGTIGIVNNKVQEYLKVTPGKHSIGSL